MEVTLSFPVLLAEFQCLFTAPSFATFLRLMTGWVLSHRRRFVTDLIWSSGSTRKGHHSKYHRFFSKSAWELDALSLLLAKLLIRIFATTGLIHLAADDTLCRKRGLMLFGTGMHHDPRISSRAKPLVSWGHDWVVLTILISCPWAKSKVWALPIGFRLYRNRQGVTKGKKKGKKGQPAPGKKPRRDPNHRTRPELLVELISLVSAWFPQRQFVLCADSAYGGQSVLSKLPANVDLISHVHPKGALYEPAPPAQPNQKGRHRKKGARLPGMAAWAADARAEVEGTQVRPVRAAHHAARENQASAVRQGRRAAIAHDRAHARRRRPAARPNVLLHAARLDAARNPLGLRWPLGDRGHLRKQQTIAGTGRCGEPHREGGAPHGAHGPGVVQLDRDVVSSSRPSTREVSRPAVVSAQARIVVRRHAHDPATPELDRTFSRRAAKKRRREKAVCPNRRISLARRLATARLGIARETRPSLHPRASRPASAVRSKYVLKKCET